MMKRRVCEPCVAVVMALASCLLTSQAGAGGERASASGCVSRGHRQHVAAKELRLQALVVPPGFVVAPFAVPVGVPLAPRSYVDYYWDYLPLPPGEGRGEGADRPQATDPSMPGDSSAGELDTPPRAESLVKRTCLQCHNTASPQGDFSVAEPKQLTADERLRAIRRLLDDDPSKRMPKGRVLEPEELGKIVQELSFIEKGE